MQRQPSPPHLSTPTAAANPINSPTDDYGPEPQSSIPVTPPSPVHDACGTEEPVIHDDSTQIPPAVDTQMGEPGHQSMPY